MFHGLPSVIFAYLPMISSPDFGHTSLISERPLVFNAYQMEFCQLFTEFFASHIDSPLEKMYAFMIVLSVLLLSIL